MGWFKKNPADKLQKQYENKMRQAMEAQRSGDINRYSELNEEATVLLKQIEGANKESA